VKKARAVLPGLGPPGFCDRRVDPVGAYLLPGELAAASWPWHAGELAGGSAMRWATAVTLGTFFLLSSNSELRSCSENELKFRLK
jgi:hypothetical protein